jgi:hypothetical protein
MSTTGRHNRTYAPQQYILDDPYGNMGIAVGVFGTPESLALPHFCSKCDIYRMHSKIVWDDLKLFGMT